MLGVKNFKLAQLDFPRPHPNPLDKLWVWTPILVFVKKFDVKPAFLKFNFDMQNEVMLRNKTKRLPSHFLGFLCSSFGSTRKQLCLRDPWLRWHRFGSRHAHRSGSYQEKEWKASSPPGIFS